MSARSLHRSLAVFYIVLGLTVLYFTLRELAMSDWINGLGIAVALLSFALAVRESALAGTERGIEDVRLLLETWHRECELHRAFDMVPR